MTTTKGDDLPRRNTPLSPGAEVGEGEERELPVRNVPLEPRRNEPTRHDLLEGQDLKDETEEGRLNLVETTDGSSKGVPVAKSLPSSPITSKEGEEKEEGTIQPLGESSRSNSLPAPPSKLELDFPASFAFDPIPPLSFSSELLESLTPKASPDVPEAKLDKEPITPEKEEDTTINEKSTLLPSKTEPASSLTPPPAPNRANSYNRSSPTTEKEFDYHLFLDQVRLPQALPIMKYLENFVREFDKKPWSVRDQLKIVAEFSDFVFSKMLDNPVWKDAVDPDNLSEPGCFASDTELFDYLQEGIEQYLMNRLHNRAFSPLGSDDRERDHVLHQRIQYFQWIEEKHLDIPTIAPPQKTLLTRAQQELVKLNNFKTPRHKMICILNCCKYLFKLLKIFTQTSEGGGADSFLPLLIFTVLRANPPKLISNLQYISRFRHPSKLQSEAGYYLTNLIGAIQFIENMDPSSLTITKEEFDTNIGKALQELTAELPQDGDDKSVGLGNQTNSLSLENLPQAASPAEPPNQEDLMDRGTQFAQRIKRPLDLVGKFFSDVASPIGYPFNQSDEVASPEPPIKPTATVSRSDEVRKKKSFLVSLFSNSSSDDDTHHDSEQTSYSTPGSSRPSESLHPEEYGQELISFQNESASCAPPLPPRRSNEPSDTKSPLPGLESVPEKVGLHPHRADATMLNFDQGTVMLHDMFPTFEVDVIKTILSAHHGNLTASTDALLEIAEVTNPYSSQYSEQVLTPDPSLDPHSTPTGEDLITFDPPPITASSSSDPPPVTD